MKIIVNEKYKNFFGKYKLILQRIISYIGIANFFMLLKVFAEDKPLNMGVYVWFIIATIGCILLAIFDSLFVIEGDSNYGFSRTPKMVKMYNNIELIMEKLGIENTENINVNNTQSTNFLKKIFKRE